MLPHGSRSSLKKCHALLAIVCIPTDVDATLVTGLPLRNTIRKYVIPVQVGVIEDFRRFPLWPHKGTLSELCVVPSARVYRKTSEDLHYDYLSLRIMVVCSPCSQLPKKTSQFSERVRCQWSWQWGAQTAVRKVNGSHSWKAKTHCGSNQGLVRAYPVLYKCKGALFTAHEAVKLMDQSTRKMSEGYGPLCNQI